MLDRKLIRKDPERVKEGIKRKGVEFDLDAFLATDERMRDLIQQTERLKHEKFLFTAGAGPYKAAVDPERLLAERVESLVSQEHAAWASHREEASRRLGAET